MRERPASIRLVLLLAAASLWNIAAGQSVPSAEGVDAAAKSAIQDCIDRIGGEQLGLPTIEQRCPQLAAALQAAGIAPLIIDSSRPLFDRYSLRRLSTLIHPAVGPAPSVAALGPVLSGLRPAPVQSTPWWRRLLDWLNDHLTPKSNPDSSYPWLNGLRRLLPHLQWLWTGIIWATVIAMPIAVVILVMREIRAMGKRSIDDPHTAGERAVMGPVESRLALLRQLPRGQRPAQLFAMLIPRLVAAGRLPQNRSLTHREIARLARLDDTQQRRLLESLARLSERQLYSGSLSMPAGLDELLARGEDLYTTGWGRLAAPE